MCVWSVVEGQKTQCGFVQSKGEDLRCPAFDSVLSVRRLADRGGLDMYMSRKGVNDWVSACRNVIVAWVRCVGRSE